MRLDGCDQRLSTDSSFPNSKLLRGFFPSIVAENGHGGPYDVVFALAVFEHFIY